VDVQEIVAWSAVACLLLAPLLLRFAAVRRALAALAERIVEQLTAEPDVDPDAFDLYQALRRQRLLEHIVRLRRILADDSHQSAVRQIGNRLAYGQLLAELAEVGEVREMARLPMSVGEAHAETTWSPVVAVAGRGGGQYAPRVEVLDFSRPRRS
jgi:hypothetical protein